LFLEWRHQGGGPVTGFSCDGIIDEPAWETSRRKVLFLAKEPNEPCDDLRLLWRQHTWNTLDTWAYGLQNLERFRIPGYAEALTSQGSAFRSSAVVNLKKTPGGANANRELVREAVARDWTFIERELDIINPDTVVCCGTFGFIRDWLFKAEPAIESNAYEDCYRRQNAVWINHCHPSARFPRKLMYYGLVGAYHGFLAKR